MGRNHCVPASYLVLQSQEKILLLLRSNTGYEDGKFSFIAGHVENGESFSQCIVREGLEEAGIVIDEANLAVIHTMYRKADEPGSSERVDVFFKATKWDGEIRNMEPEKCSELSWFDIQSLPENIIPYIRRAVEYVLSGVSYSEYGWKREEI